MRAILFILLYLISPIALSGPVAFQWLAVPYGELTLEDVRSSPATEWHTVSAEDTFNHGFSDKDYWLKVSLPVDKRNRLLVIGYPLLDEVSVYWTVAGQLIETHHTGDKLPFSSRPIVHRNFVFLVPASTEPLTAWVRAHTDGSAQIPVSVTASAEFLAKEQASFGWQAMFVGVVLALVLYNFFLFVMVRDTTYLWYVATVFTTSLVQLNFNGLLFQWLWPNTPWLNEFVTAPLVGAALIFGVTFTIKFLSLRHFSLASYRLLWLIRLLAILLLGYSIFVSYHTGIALVSALAAIGTPMVWLVALRLWRRGQALAGYYVLAWTPLLVGHLALATSKLGLIPRSLFTEMAPQAGVAIEAVLLSFALAYRINIERQKRQEAQDHALAVQRDANLTLESRVQARTEELQKANELLKAASLTDGLTGVANRRRFDEKLNEEWQRAVRHDQELSLILVDIDHFKKVNDTLGHLTGDDCLVAVAHAIDNEVQRAIDLLARYGGEEFAVLLPTTGSEGAEIVAERLRVAIESSPVDSGDGKTPVNLTISLGVATLLASQHTDPQELIRRADEALYRAKNTGRNRVVVWRDSQTTTIN
ncbi:sensor domain-containing diguanylate cyclase [Marinobacter litoralis]|uniref:sensor domain-containing diguanylate cyclase n=1 Tax=Marinobacter litoralis TaxID=187981 RepID=UPI001D0DBCF4|nr:diguanylate cyclase [Marinobacter litoralis]